MIKIIENKKVDIPNLGGIISFSALILMTLNTPPPGGFKEDTMEKAEAIREILKTAKKGEIKIDDSLLKDLKFFAENTGWNFSHKELIKFLKYIKGI